MVNANGTITVVSGYSDTLGDTSFSYEVMNAPGTDVGSWDVVPCFVEGARMERHAAGGRPVEDVVVGDLVLTLDSGFQPVRWRGGAVHDRGRRLRCCAFQPGTFGDHGPLGGVAAAPVSMAGRTLLW